MCRAEEKAVQHHAYLLRLLCLFSGVASSSMTTVTLTPSILLSIPLKKFKNWVVVFGSSVTI